MRKPVYVLCEQQRRRSACASAQFDQRLCCSLLRLYNISRSIAEMSRLQLASVAAQAGLCLARSETPEDTFCRVVVQLCIKNIIGTQDEALFTCLMLWKKLSTDRSRAVVLLLFDVLYDFVVKGFMNKELRD